MTKSLVRTTLRSDTFDQIYFICNVSARLSKRFIIRAGHVSSYMSGNIEYKTS
jgi:hypothetical protein